MSNFLDKMKYFFGLNEDDELIDEGYHQANAGNYRPAKTNSPQPQYQQNTSNDFDPSTDVTYSNEGYTYRQKSKINRESQEKPFKRMTICKYSPINYDETTSIIDDIKNGFPVIINFETTDDFASANILKACEGGAYALNAEIKKIANEIFLIVPDSIEVLSHIAAIEKEK